MKTELILKVDCPACGGEKTTRKIIQPYMGKPKFEKVTCYYCKGKGFVLTEEGETILDFLICHQDTLLEILGSKEK